MGLWLSKLYELYSSFSEADPARILMLGLDAAGLLFVVDSSDRERMVEAQEELYGILKSDELPREIPVVVIANKQDLPCAMKTSEIADALQLSMLRDRKWHIQGACATTGDGIYESVNEMSRLLV
ncbi:hypothetical protein KUTeg_012897 [Tegillarca granosa]|uniref:Uncharacterized protein n=1 Tax=Tegillarca granosa TaxID=220873 RepID=A0ABQ9EXM5_TEGGR|nr:hypothetical protein KUTeg_012897 [Tegillarca granosa]